MKILGFHLCCKINAGAFFSEFFPLFTGVAWLSSVRVVRCLVNSCSERNFDVFFLKPSGFEKKITAHHSERKVKMMSNRHGPYGLGYFACYNGRYKNNANLQKCAFL